MAAVSELILGASASAWQKVGLTVEDHTARVGAVTLRFAPHERGLARWGPGRTATSLARTHRYRRPANRRGTGAFRPGTGQ